MAPSSQQPAVRYRSLTANRRGATATADLMLGLGVGAPVEEEGGHRGVTLLAGKVPSSC